MRKGPHPLATHLGMLASNMKGVQKYTSNFKTDISANDAVQMMRGIKIYQEHHFMQLDLSSKIIWSDGETKIKKPATNNIKTYKSDYPLILVPSLINKSNILDISEERSMLRWFNNNGIETYLLDWGNISTNSKDKVDINHIIQRKLSKSILAVSEITGKPVDVMGYCMGGTLLVASCYMNPDIIRRMVLIASPWDFSIGVSGLARNVRIWSPSVLPVINDRGFLPSEWVRSLFASIDPNGSAQKFIKFASMDQDSLEAKLFISVEDWLNDGIDLPKDVACHCIQDWFIDNKLFSGKWNIASQHIDTDKIEADILIIASKADKLVPLKCATNIQNNLKKSNIKTIELNCGHIGLIVGRNAIKDVWTPILSWLAK